MDEPDCEGMPKMTIFLSGNTKAEKNFGKSWKVLEKTRIVERNFIEKAIKLFLVIFKHREDVKNVSSLFSALVIKIAQPLLIGSGWWNQSCFDYLICPLISDWALD